jgi:hypothetical protein
MPADPSIGDTYRRDGVTRTLTWIGAILMRCKQKGVRGELWCTRLGWSGWIRNATAVKRKRT